MTVTAYVTDRGKNRGLAGYMFVCRDIEITTAWLQLGRIIFRGLDGIIKDIRHHHLLAAQKTCQSCSINMRVRRQDNVADKFGISNVRLRRASVMAAFSRNIKFL